MEPEKKDWKAAFVELLEMIPLLGKPLGWIFKHLGVSGLLSFLAGAALTAILVYLGKYPTNLVSGLYKTPISKSPENGPQTKEPELPSASPPGKVVGLHGFVYDIFGNPLQGAVVVIPSSERYTTTTKQGRYTFQNIPFQSQMNLEIIGGEGGVAVTLDQQDIGEVIQLDDTLIRNPLTSDLNPILCSEVGEKQKEPIGKFDPLQADQYEIRLKDLEEEKESGLRLVYCFVTIFGPDDYELNKNLQLIYDWYNNGELVRRFEQNDFEPKPYGWRSWARKKVWRGKWQLVIHTDHKIFEKIYFTII